MSSTPRVLILNGTCLDVLPAHRAHLSRLGVDWVADPSFRSLSPDRLDELLAGAHGLILPASIRRFPSAAQMARHATIQTLSIAASGYDWLDVEAATQHGIVVSYAPVQPGVEVVADMTWGLLLAVARQIPHHDRQMRAGRHDRGMGVSVWAKTLGIVGLGRIGRAVARRARGFEMSVLACEPDPDLPFVQAQAIELVDLDRLLEQSDFVSLHVRLDRDTQEMIGRRELDLMKSSAYLINTARRELVAEDALVDAILNRRIAGAGLDDPPSRPENPLVGLPNVVFTPHLGNRAVEGVHAVFLCAVNNAVAVLEGRRPEFLVNPEVYARPRRQPTQTGIRLI